MKLTNGTLDLSASDVSAAFGCNHRTALDIAVARGELAAPSYFSSMTAALRARGIEHEQRYVETLRNRGSLTDLSDLRGEDAELATLTAMRAGTQVIVQAALRHGVWNGRADILLRVEEPSELGAFSYEPVDTKLARETRAASILQLAFYAELLAPQLGRLPARFCVVAPGEGAAPFREQWLRVDDFHAYFRFVRATLAEATERATEELLNRDYPEPVEHCDVCRWWEHCDTRKRKDDHLSLVAGITRLQRRALEEQAVSTLAQLAQVERPAGLKLARGSQESFDRVQQQARVQWLGRNAGTPIHELLDAEPGQGLLALPLPSAGDVFLDLEGDPFGGDHGREYLFGYVYLSDSADAHYVSRWARNATEERQCFEELIDWLTERWRTHPGMHIYHYAPYEPSAFKRLMGRYAARADEMDRLLRGKRFVDLYRVVRNGLRASVERYSIKDLEAFYGFERSVPLRDASRNLRSVEQALELGALNGLEAEVLQSVEGYNRDDCLSAYRLREWLEHLRSELEQRLGAQPRPPLQGGEPSEEVDAEQSKASELAQRLLVGVPIEAAERSPEQKARWTLAHSLEFHRREEKSGWWDYFRMCELTEDELRDERSALSGLTFLERIPGKKKRELPTDRYRFADQDYDVRDGQHLCAVGGEKLGEVVGMDRAARTVDIKKVGAMKEVHPGAAFVHDHVSSKPIPTALFALATWVAEHGLDGPQLEHRAALDLLLCRPPRLRQGALAAHKDESPVERAVRVAGLLDHTVLPIQGPPGAGKSYTGAHMICGLLAQGKTVGIAAGSHKVIRNLLEQAVKRASEAGLELHAVAKVSKLSEEAPSFTEVTDAKQLVKAAREQGANLLAGTPWLWAREDCGQLVDVLFVDEAGQMALPNALAVAQGARSLVLLGDPQQLEQPIKGAHPDGVEVSALHHLLQGHKTVPDDRGLFLGQTFRLAPSICALTSELFYEGRLASRPEAERQRLHGTDGLDGSHLWFLPCAHTGCQNTSDAEVDAVEGLVNRLLKRGASWTNSNGQEIALEGDDILIVAPYNAQVARLSERLGSTKVRIGTVDKFQGQEGPVVIYSMTTSTPQDAPRGMEFLYSPNRLNVATSRAQCACFLVASPSLLEPECKTVRHLQLANAFCRYLELAKPVG